MATLLQKNTVANTKPVKNVASVTAPDDPGTKNPITDEANKSFATSASVWAINATCSLFNAIHYTDMPILSTAPKSVNFCLMTSFIA